MHGNLIWLKTLTFLIKQKKSYLIFFAFLGEDQKEKSLDQKIAPEIEGKNNMSLPEPELTLTKIVNRPSLLSLATMAALIAGFLLKINNHCLLHIKQSCCYPCFYEVEKGKPPNALTMPQVILGDRLDIH